MRALLLASILLGCGGQTTDMDAAVKPACDAACGQGSICIHEYYTHDPPPPLPEGGTCPNGPPVLDRCWSVTDRCDVVPAKCSAQPTCSCPDIVIPRYPQHECQCHGDGTYDCYTVGL